MSHLYSKMSLFSKLSHLNSLRFKKTFLLYFYVWNSCRVLVISYFIHGHKKRDGNLCPFTLTFVWNIGISWYVMAGIRSFQKGFQSKRFSVWRQFWCSLWLLLIHYIRARRKNFIWNGFCHWKSVCKKPNKINAFFEATSVNLSVISDILSPTKYILLT